MNKRSTTRVLASSLLGVSSIGLLGCFEEDYPNYNSEAAFQGGSRAFQLWTGNEDHPNNLAGIPWANGQGELVPGGFGDLDCWPVSLFDPGTWEVGDVAYFQVALYMEPGTAGLVQWQTRDSFATLDDEWTFVGPSHVFGNSSDQAQWTYWTVPVVEGRLLYSFNIFGIGKYGFGLIPIYNN